MNYSILSKNLTSQLTKEDKKKQGIYFTPPACIYNNLKLLKPFISNIHNVLEPSCGSGEYIIALQNTFSNINIVGIEQNKIIYDSILFLQNKNTSIYSQDYLQYTSEITFDLIIGNPPYYVMKKENVSKEYYIYFDGRPNMFILFIIKSLHLLNDNGILSFILPKSFLNCLYYDKTRKYISTKFQILYIIECKEKYLDTEQETILFIIQKKNIINNEDFIIKINQNIIFSFQENIIKLKELYSNSTSLSELGFKVNVGNVVWNQCKDILTDDETKTRLIYSSDINNNNIILKKYSNVEKKNFINKSGMIKPIIVINRGYGVGKYKFEYCLINESKEYLIENHLICIEYENEDITHDDLIILYNKILLSFKNNKTLQFIKLYFGNNAINTTELNYLLPIYF
jgi:adenine-specific DNA-methyltransferase